MKDRPLPKRPSKSYPIARWTIFATLAAACLALIFSLSQALPLTELWSQLFGPKPCEQPILYSIGTLDPQFKLSQKSFLNDINQAEMIWEKAINRDLFRQDPNGTLKINLVYDVRQQATDRLHRLGITLKNDRATYDLLLTKYQALKKTIDQKEAAFKKALADFNARAQAFQTQVDAANKNGGASRSLYTQLIQEQEALNQQEQALHQTQTSLNNQISDLNTIVDALNQQAKLLNLNVGLYQKYGAPISQEFEEGVYEKNATGTSITVYQYDDQSQLVRVLTHELGHALGLEHVDDPKAVMYRLNRDTNATLTDADIEELKRVCGIK